MGHSSGRLLSACAAAALAAVAAAPAFAADFGGDCCADLEERIAELEATTARKGNRKVSLTVSGHVNSAVLFWDDGTESNAYVVGNKNDQTNFSFTGEAVINSEWTAGYAITIRLEDNLSDTVDQTTDDGGFGFVLWESNWFLDSKRLGRVTVGQASRVSDTAPENDLSETGVAGYAGVQDGNGAFLLRRADGVLSALTYGDIYNHLNGDTANVVRYDTPELAGFVLSASFGEDDIWDVGAKYEGESRGFKIAASIAYTESTDESGIDGSGDVPNSTIVGSVAVLHEPSGLNALISAGRRSFDAAVLDADNVFRTPADASFIYAKLGLIAKLTALGSTNFYAEYGHFSDFATAGYDGDTVASLASGGVCATPGNCRIGSVDADVWGLGVVQSIEAAEMQIYLGYRHHETDVDLIDGGGTKRGTDLNDFDRRHGLDHFLLGAAPSRLEVTWRRSPLSVAAPFVY